MWPCDGYSHSVILEMLFEGVIVSVPYIFSLKTIRVGSPVDEKSVFMRFFCVIRVISVKFNGSLLEDWN
jgi:hypothetical protein